MVKSSWTPHVKQASESSFPTRSRKNIDRVCLITASCSLIDSRTRPAELVRRHGAGRTKDEPWTRHASMVQLQTRTCNSAMFPLNGLDKLSTGQTLIQGTCTAPCSPIVDRPSESIVCLASTGLPVSRKPSAMLTATFCSVCSCPPAFVRVSRPQRAYPVHAQYHATDEDSHITGPDQRLGGYGGHGGSEDHGGVERLLRVSRALRLGPDRA